jgi:TolB-like protein
MDVLTEVDKEKVCSYADKILSSRYFFNSTRQQRFLDYLIKHTLEDETEHLKGYTIAVEVFDKDINFDPNTDSIVRVEATRIRNKLREYYEKEGSSDEIQIHFRKGSYKLDFSFAALPNKDDTNQSFKHPKVITSKPSLVVLPFVSISADSSRNYFADGITDSLISLLSRLSGLFIISRQSSYAYKDTVKTSKEIATELGVQFLLEGSIQHSGDRVRIAARLITANDSTHVWSERYDRDLTDIFSLQDELSQQIVSALQVQLTSEEDRIFGLKATHSLQAHDTLLRGIEAYLKYSQQTTEYAIELFNQVLDLDANYVAANAWLARALSFMWAMHWDRTPQILESAFHYAQKALELDSDSPYANSIIGWVLMWKEEIADSIQYCKKAISLDPNNAEALLFLSMTLSSDNQGEEALVYIEKAMRFTPTSAPFYEYALGNCYFVLKEYKKALSAYDKGIQLNNNFMPNHYGQICTFAQLGMQQEIEEKLQRYEQLSSLIRLADNPIWVDSELLSEVAEIKKLTLGYARS